MPMNLRDRIRQALNEPLDGDVFEECAATLLKPHYADLQWVSGPNDAGQDGLGETQDGTKFVLVVTTQRNYSANLRKSLRSYQRAGGDLRAVVFATSRSVSGQMRTSLPKKIAAEFDTKLLAIHDQAKFVDLLYDSPAWRRKLLPAVSAPVSALTRDFSRAFSDLSLGLVGRDVEQEQLLAATGDVIVSGVPGVGKSYLLEHLCKAHDWAWLDLSRDRSISISDLADDISDKKPVRIIADDVHFDLEHLALLDQLRQELDVPFHIVACCWPTRLDDVRSRRPHAQIVNVSELTRDQIRDIVIAAGVNGPPALHATILEQARGRPGLAVLLARACADNRVIEAVRGDLLARHTLAFLQRALSHNPRHELAILALTDTYGASVETVSTVLGKDLGSVADMLRTVATSGTIDEAPWQRGALVVQPESLRYALVRETFFSGPGSLNVRSVVAKLPEPTTAAIPLIVAALRGARVDRDLINKVTDWRDRRTVVAYAQLGPQELKLAIQRAPRCLSEIARETLQAQGVSDTLVHALLTASVGDNRPKDQTSDHPLRVLSDFFKMSRCGIDQRESAIRAAVTWAEHGGSSEHAAHVIVAALYPGIDEGETDLVLPRTLHLRYGPFRPHVIRELARLWDIALDFLRRHSTVPPRVILDGLQRWLYPGLLARSEHEDDESDAAIRVVGLRVAADLAGIYADRPIALRTLAARANPVGAAIAVPVRMPFDALYREPISDEDMHLVPPRLTEAEKCKLDDAAAESAEQEIEQIADLIAEIEYEATTVGVVSPPLLPEFAESVARKTTDAVALARAFMDRNCASEVLNSIVRHIAEEEQEGYWHLVNDMFRQPHYRQIALWAMCSEAAPADIRTMLVTEYRRSDLWVVANCFIDGQLSSEELALMLEDTARPEAQELAVQLLASARYAADSETVLPNEVRQRCRELVAGYRLLRVDGDLASRGNLGLVLRDDTELFAEWLCGWFERASANPGEWLDPYLCDMLRKLPVEIRHQLIGRIPADLRSLDADDVVAELVSNDLDNARALFARSDLEHLHSSALTVDAPDEAWLQIALSALDADHTIDAVAYASEFGRGIVMWGGSTSIQTRIDQFNALRDVLAPGQREAGEQLLDACVALHERLRDKEQEREHHEEVFGLPSHD